ncbi:MAG: heme ABC exporter ATP-binding protein CcmA [Alphaproteobacteria bacterium]
MTEPASLAPAALVRATALACRRVGREIFRDIDLEVRPGEALVLRGPNGSGKSTLLRVLAGLLEPAGGEFALAGARDGGPGYHYIGHADPLKPGLTVEENLAFTSALTGAGDIEAGLRAFALTRLADAPARQLSSGQRRRLTLARLAAVAKPIWLLDEPAVGLDAASRARLEALIAAHRRAGGAVLAATHGDIAIADADLLELGR